MHLRWGRYLVEGLLKVLNVDFDRLLQLLLGFYRRTAISVASGVGTDIRAWTRKVLPYVLIVRFASDAILSRLSFLISHSLIDLANNDLVFVCASLTVIAFSAALVLHIIPFTVAGVATGRRIRRLFSPVVL